MQLPFYPIYGDAMQLNNFGGALFVYMWMTGVPQNVHDHIYRTFIEDIYARYFVTSTKRNEDELKEDGLKSRVKLQGKHSQSKGTITFYI